MNTKSLLICLLSIFTFYQCKEECAEIYAPVCGSDGQLYLNSCTANAAGVSFTEGLCTYITTGKILNVQDTVYNCDWVFQNEAPYYLILSNLPETFKQHGLKVEMTYESISDEISSCMINGKKEPTIHVHNIEIREL